MAVRANDLEPHPPECQTASPSLVARSPFGPGRRPRGLAWFANRHPAEKGPPYAPAPHDDEPRSRVPARPHGEAPIPGKVPTDVRAQSDSTPERCPQALLPR